MTLDVRWIQRLSNWTRALNQLSKFMEITELDELEGQGLIKSFNCTFELAWKTQMDYLKEQGVTELHGAKDVARVAFNRGLITNKHAWMEMIKDRNLTNQAYKEDIANRIVGNIVNEYYSEFQTLHQKLTDLAKSSAHE